MITNSHKIYGQASNESGKIDEESHNSVGKGDDEKGGYKLGDSQLNRGGSLAIDPNAKHDHHPIKDKGESKKHVGNVSKGAPKGKDGGKSLKAIARSRGVGLVDDVALFEI